MVLACHWRSLCTEWVGNGVSFTKLGGQEWEDKRIMFDLLLGLLLKNVSGAVCKKVRSALLTETAQGIDKPWFLKPLNRIACKRPGAGKGSVTSKSPTSLVKA